MTYKMTYTIGDNIKTENINKDAMQILRWYWRNIQAND